MKKAKIVLTVIFIVTAISGTFAFKATRVAHVFFSKGAGGRCTVPFNTTYTTQIADAVNPATFLVPYATIADGPWPIVVYKCF